MNRWLCVLILLLSACGAGFAQAIWLENFTGLTNGVTSDGGATAWTTVQPSTGTFAKAQVFGQDVFIIDNTTTEGIWTSQVINIAALGEVAIEATLGANFASAADYVRAFYKLDGGPEVQFGETTGTPALVVSTAASTIVIGNTVQIVIRGKDNTAGTTAGIPNAVGFDDVTLTKIGTLYSRATGNWDDVNTWSTTGYGGATCNCTPDDNSRVMIGNSKTVSLNVAGFVSGITVQNTGVLQWTAANLAMTMRHGGPIDVQTGGIMTKNAQTGSSIIFNSYAYLATVNGALTIGTLTYNSGATFIVGGAGVLTAGTVTAAMGTSRFITNNITGPGASFKVTGNINFPTSTSSYAVFNNNGTLTAAQLFFDDTNVSFNNTGSVTLTGNLTVNSTTDDNNKITNSLGATLSFAGIATNTANFFIDNSGTITQSGNFVNFDNASSFKNLATGVWNWSLTPNTGFDTDVLTVLDLSAAGNTFNYNGAGNQNILPINYSNLSLSTSGTKTRTAGGLITVGGNLLIQNTAILDISTPVGTDITVAGNWTAAAATSFTEGLRTVTFNGSGTQTVSNASGTEIFYNLILNTGASTNRVQLSNNIAVTNVLTLTRGGLSINGNSATLSNSATTAMTSTANGFIVSETTSAPYSRLIWNMKTTTGTFNIPFADASGAAIPLIFNKTAIGIETGLGTGTFSFATYHTASNNTPYPSTVTDVNRFGSDNSTNVADRFWIIVPSGYTTVPDATLTFTVTAAEATGIASNTLRAQHWTPATLSWDPPIAGQTNPTPATQAQVVIPGASISSIWTLSGNNLPLPIELLSFTAKVSGNEVITFWKTATELHNQFFTVQNTIDGEKFYDVGIVKGQGDSFEEHSYTFTDPSPFVGKSYYRLKQTDYDGKYTYSKIVAIEFARTNSLTLKAFPNPFNGITFSIEISGIEGNAMVPVAVYNLQGQKVFESILTAAEPGLVRNNIELRSPLPAGLYIVRAGELQQLTLRLVVN